VIQYVINYLYLQRGLIFIFPLFVILQTRGLFIRGIRFPDLVLGEVVRRFLGLFHFLFALHDRNQPGAPQSFKHVHDIGHEITDEIEHKQQGKQADVSDAG
jgi:hypothetical protein